MHNLMYSEASLAGYVAFIACVVLATVVQNLTGFALGLILLGLVALFELVPVAEAANAATVLTLVNALVYFRSHKAEAPWALMRPALVSSFFGVGLGVASLAWLSANATEWLRLLLGLSVVASASVLVMHRRRMAQPSPPRAFACAGFFAGVLGGMFATSGPPMVFHMYRQPFEMETIRRCLMLVFASNAATRLVLVGASGGFTLRSAWLSVLAVPVVFAVTRWMAGRTPALSRRALGWVAAGFLVLTGVSLSASAVDHLLPRWDLLALARALVALA
ncbi:sulfite exporter TauE/SafE family protein [Ramlibacter sp. AN1015]|uniref:sulfite exporter TauE/SafE family protein n=1 Tax=Ramlibacter sp. AN1015 TaxID=3133428 RepID=UPI0030C03806